MANTINFGQLVEVDQVRGLRELLDNGGGGSNSSFANNAGHLETKPGSYYLDLVNATGTLDPARLSGNYNITVTAAGIANTALFANSAANANFATSAGSANTANTANYANTAGLAANATFAVSANTATIANTANKLTTPRKIKLTGSAAGEAMFDGTADIEISVAMTGNTVVANAAYANNSGHLGGQAPSYYLGWNNFNNTPTTLSGYGITDAAKISDVGDISTNYMTIVYDGDSLGLSWAPTGLNFVDNMGRLDYADITTVAAVPGLSYTRSGNATAWRKDGTLAVFAPNVPRITDAGVTIEGQRTNLFARWDPTAAQVSSKIGCIDATAPVVAPLAGRNWVALDNSSESAFIYQVGPSAASTAYSISVFVETTDGSQPVVGTNTSSGDFGFVLAGDLVLSSANYRRVVGNVWLVSVTTTTKATPIGTRAGIVRYVGQSKRPLKFSGFQLELGTRASTPIITTGGAATVGADNLALAKTIAAGEDFTVVTEVDIQSVPNDSVSKRFIELNDGGAANRVMVVQSNGNVYGVATVNGVGSPPIGTLAGVGVGRRKIALRRSGTVVTLAVSGIVRGSSAALTAAPTLNRLCVGSTSGAATIDATVASTLLFPYALTDAELVELTR